uniref:Uncharacterized protein n=1 Tax=Panstrongylus lignarius TaxID=156445 RepID=A0A224Y238_9HEMI
MLKPNSLLAVSGCLGAVISFRAFLRFFPFGQPFFGEPLSDLSAGEDVAGVSTPEGTVMVSGAFWTVVEGAVSVDDSISQQLKQTSFSTAQK